MPLTVGDALRLGVMQNVRVVAGHQGLARQIRWVHIIDIPEIVQWVRGGELLLSTGYGWPKDPSEQARVIRELDRIGLAGLLIETGRFYDRIPSAILKTADAVDLPVLEGPWELPFVDITEAVDRLIIRDQYEMLERSEEIHRALTAAAVDASDLQHIANTLSHLIRKSVSIEDREFRLLAHAEHERELDPVRERTIALAETPQEIRTYLLRRGILDQIRSSTRPVHIAGQPEIGMRDRVVCPIRIGGDLVGYVCILQSGVRLSDLDLRAAEHAATLAALHILRQQSLAAAEARVRHTFVDALLRGELDRPQGLLERARLLGFTPDALHLVAVCAVLNPAGGARKWALTSPDDVCFRDQVGQELVRAFEGEGYRTFQTYALNQVILVIELDHPQGNLRQKAQRAWSRVVTELPDHPLMLAVGRSSVGLPGVSRSYRDADVALTHGKHGPGVVWSEDLLLTRILSTAADREAIIQLHDEVFGRLRRRRHGAALAATVHALVGCDFNQAAAAKALFIHRNTMRQRLARIEESLGERLSGADVRVKMVLATEIESLLAPGQGESAVAS